MKGMQARASRMSSGQLMDITISIRASVSHSIQPSYLPLSRWRSARLQFEDTLAIERGPMRGHPHVIGSFQGPVVDLTPTPKP